MSRLAMMLLMQTLFPDPVAPAISRCGICVRSTTTRRPLHVAPQRQRQAALALDALELRRLHDPAQRHDAGVHVGHFDADDRLARYRRFDPNGGCGQG